MLTHQEIEVNPNRCCYDRDEDSKKSKTIFLATQETKRFALGRQIKSREGNELFLYMPIVEQTISLVIMQEDGRDQHTSYTILVMCYMKLRYTIRLLKN
ncbi:hypothetical protein CR513_31044, partial [Mucuna pruriens]